MPAALALLLAISVATSPGEPPQAPASPGETEDFDAQLRRQPYFQKIVWTTERSFAPYEVLVQTQAVPEPGYEAKVAQFYGPWLLGVAKRFEDSVATPAGLPPGSNPLPIRLVVLASEGDYLNYAKTIHRPEGQGHHEFYDDRIRAVVVCWNPGAPDHVRRSDALRLFVFALLHQRSTGFDGRQAPLWLRQGISSALSWHVAPDPATAFTKPLIHPELLEGLVKDSQDPAKQNRFLLPFTELASVVSVEDLWRRVRAKSGTTPIREEDVWYGGYVSQCCLWVHYLRRERAPAHNAAFAEYLRAAMRGGGSPADLKRAFEGIDLAALDREFFRWCYARYQDSGKPKPDEARLLTLFAVPEGADTPGGPAAASRLAGLAPFLAPPSNDADATLGLACRRAAGGDVEGALEDLAKALAAEPDAVGAARLRTEVRRLEGWKLARDAWLAELVATGGRFQLERDGKKVHVKPKRIEEGKLFYDAAKTEQSLSVISLEPVEVAAQMKASPAGAPAWARAYGMLLGDDERWDKLLKDKGPESLALRADAAGAYARIRLAAMATSHLRALAAQAELADKAAPEAVLGQAKAMMLEVPNHPHVLERIAAVRELVQAAAQRLYDERKPRTEFQGKATWIDAEEVELFYDFDSPSELDDWTSRPREFVDWRESYGRLQGSPALRGMGVEGGAWRARGSYLYRHFLHFETPMTVSLEWRQGSAENPEGYLTPIVLGTCSEGVDSYLAMSSMGEITLRDAGTNKDWTTHEGQEFLANVGDLLRLEMAHDGQRLRSVYGGVAREEPDVRPRVAGEVFLLIHGDREVFLESIKIRGRIGAEGKRRLRERWIAAKVKDVGL